MWTASRALCSELPMATSARCKDEGFDCICHRQPLGRYIFPLIPLLGLRGSYMKEYFYQTIFRANLGDWPGFSPVGDGLWSRARKFPALVNCTTIDWRARQVVESKQL